MLDREKTVIKQTIDARKEPVTEKSAWGLLQDAQEIIVGRGKKHLSFKPSAANKTEILQNCLGRTGNLRAPALKISNKYIIGFTEDMYEKYLAK